MSQQLPSKDNKPTKQVNNKYLEAVRGDLTAFQEYLLHGTPLTPEQWETWDKIDSARAWLKAGHSDGQVLKMLGNLTKLKDRRCREILTLSYAVFAELRQGREKEGVKQLYAEMFRDAAKKALDNDDYYNYGILLDKAAKIDGAYDNQKVVDTDAYKKATKVVFKVKQLTINNGTPDKKSDTDNDVIDISHEPAE